MAMLATGLVAQHAKKHKRWLAMLILLPFAVIALCVAAVVISPDTAGQQGKDCAPAGSSNSNMAGYLPAQIANAAVIVATGKNMNVPEQGWVVAITAAMQESGLTNLDHGDRDSLGLFQERPSQGWGSPQQIMDTTYASTQFYNHLLQVPNWPNLSVNDAAQAVERSGFPDAYGPHEQAAREVVGALQGATCQPGNGGTLATDPQAQTVINAALSQLGVPFVWGGGTASGPSGPGGSKTGLQGFDCSGLALYAYAQIGVAVPHQTQAIWAAFQPAIKSAPEIQPGDLILLSTNGTSTGDIHHVAIYLGPQNGGTVVEAPQTGESVKKTSGIWNNPYWTGQFIGAVHPIVVSRVHLSTVRDR